MAAPAISSVGAYWTGVSTTSPLIDVPVNMASGDLIEISIYREDTGDPTTVPSGFVQKGKVSVTGAGAHTQFKYWKRATGADSGTYDFIFTANVWTEAVAIRITGAIATGDPYDTGTGAPNTAVTASNTTVTAAVSLTTLDVDRLVIWVGTNFNGGFWSGYTGGFAAVVNGPDLAVAQHVQPVAGSTGSITGTCSVAGFNTAWLGAILPSTPDPVGQQTIVSQAIKRASIF